MTAVLPRIHAFPNETAEALYDSHRRLTCKMFGRGLTSSERRRLARCRAALNRMFAEQSPAMHYDCLAARRHGRARRLAQRKSAALLGALLALAQPEPEISNAFD